MADEPKRQEPEIMPPVPQEEPQRNVPEIPPDKDAPEKEGPNARLTSSASTRKTSFSIVDG